MPNSGAKRTRKPAKSPKEQALRALKVYSRYNKSAKGKERRKRYAQTAQSKYASHKYSAKRRGIPFLLTFEQWLKIWMDSGHFDERGNTTAEGYVMARKGDVGPYAEGNVSIVQHRVNVAERNRTVAAKNRNPYGDWRHEWETEDWKHIHEAPDLD